MFIGCLQNLREIVVFYHYLGGLLVDFIFYPSKDFEKLNDFGRSLLADRSEFIFFSFFLASGGSNKRKIKIKLLLILESIKKFYPNLTNLVRRLLVLSNVYSRLNSADCEEGEKIFLFILDEILVNLFLHKTSSDARVKRLDLQLKVVCNLIKKYLEIHQTLVNLVGFRPKLLELI